MMTDAAGERLERAVTTFAAAARLLDSQRLHVWDERGLTLPQLRILFQVRQRPGIGVRDLAAIFDVSASNITQQVDKLVGRGLVGRAERPEDRRQVAHRLTPDGEHVAEEISAAMRVYLRGLLGGLSPAEQEELTRLLTRLRELADGLVAPGPAHG
jgi:DNA-binding MarR family transcriptional regulator